MKNTGFFLFPLLVLGTALLLVSCAAEKANTPGGENFNPRLSAVDRIFGSSGLVGYLKKERMSGDGSPSEIHFVCDAKLRTMGFITDKGQAYRYDSDGIPRLLAAASLEQNVRLILGEKGAVRIEAGPE